MTPLEVVEAIHAAGVTLGLDAQARLTADPPGRLTPEIKVAVRTHKDQLKAVVKLRARHRSMGFSEADVLFIERAILEGKVTNLVVIVPGPAGVTA